MRLKACAFCRKEIPSSITVCPYCRRDEQGQDVAAAEAPVLTALDAQGQNELNQLGSDDPVTRKSAADRLCQKGSPIIPLLITVLNEHTHKGTAEVARLLGRMQDRRAVNALIQALKIGNEDVRISAVWALSQFREPEVLQELLRESERNNPTVQGYLAHVFAGQQEPRVVASLLKLAQHSSHEVSFQAIWALGEAGDKSAILPLRRALGRGDPLVKAVAEAALRRLGGPVRRAFSPAIVMLTVMGLVSALGVCGWFFYR